MLHVSDAALIQAVNFGSRRQQQVVGLNWSYLSALDDTAHCTNHQDAAVSQCSLNASQTCKDRHYSPGNCFAEASPACLILLVPLML